jgi:hypothetical protein
MKTWLALIAALALSTGPARGGQEPPADPKQEIEKLKAAVAALRKDLSDLQKQSIEDARTIQRLREIIKAFESQPEPAARPAVAAPESSKVSVEVGPSQPLTAKLELVNVKTGFVVINKGERDGVKAGYRFEIFRETQEPGAVAPKRLRLGAAEFEKYMGDDSGMSKLKVIEGNAADMREYDLAVAIRKLEKVTLPDAPPTPTPVPGVPGGAFQITGRAGDGYVVNYGSADGAKQTEILYVYKEGKLRARLRIDSVEKRFCVGNVISGSLVSTPEIGDTVTMRELKGSTACRVALSDEKQGYVAIEARLKDGVKVGDRFIVRRHGQKVGTIRIFEVYAWGSKGKPDGETKFTDIQRGDFAERIEE